MCGLCWTKHVVYPTVRELSRKKLSYADPVRFRAFPTKPSSRESVGVPLLQAKALHSDSTPYLSLEQAPIFNGWGLTDRLSARQAYRIAEALGRSDIRAVFPRRTIRCDTSKHEILDTGYPAEVPLPTGIGDSRIATGYHHHYLGIACNDAVAPRAQIPSERSLI